MGRQQPRSVTNAIRSQWALVVVSGVAALLTVVQRDDLVRSWAEGNANARPILQQGGLEALEDNAIAIPAFGPVAIVSFIVFAALAAILIAFFRGGHKWAWICLLAMAGSHLFAMVVVYRLDLPVSFVVAVVVSVVLDLVLAYFLVHPDTNEYIRGAGLAAHHEG